MSKHRLTGELRVPGDKSITHRAFLFSALATGETRIETNALGRDNLACVRVLGQLGVRIDGALTPMMQHIAAEEQLTQFETSEDGLCHLRVVGVGFDGFSAPDTPLDCGNSGTLGRLLTGYLAGLPFEATLVGDASLSQRPFRRVTAPLSVMGAKFSGDMLPLRVTGCAELQAIEHFNEKASAQVKSAILIAGLRAGGTTVVTEPHRSRDHSERMLSAMGAKILEAKNEEGLWRVSLQASDQLQSLERIAIPGDFSAAAFFLVAASIFDDSELVIRGVGVNPTRVGLLYLLRRMGASIELENAQKIGGELVADILIRKSPLEGIDVDREEVVMAIDEIPILCVAAVAAKGITRVRGAEELRVKETDRLSQMVGLLRSFGVEVEEYEDGIDVHACAPQDLKQSPVDAPWRTSGDHRIAMSGAILELWASGAYRIDDGPAVETSFPNFSGTLDSCAQVR